MGIADDAHDKVDEMKGRAKESAGAATDDDELRREGKVDQAKSKMSQKVEDAADAVKDKLR